MIVHLEQGLAIDLSLSLVVHKMVTTPTSQERLQVGAAKCVAKKTKLRVVGKSRESEGRSHLWKCTQVGPGWQPNSSYPHTHIHHLVWHYTQRPLHPPLPW